MRMMIWAFRIPKHFLIHVRVMVHAIKEIEFGTKSQEAIRAVQSANLEVNLAKMAYKDELKDTEQDDTPQQAVGAGKGCSLRV